MILVTGANGLIGNYLCHELAESGEKVLALVRDRSNLKGVHENIEVVEGDINDPLSIKKAVSKSHTIIHTAARVSFKRRDREKMFETNVNGTSNLIDLALANDVKKFIHFSSVSALGSGKSTYVNEQTAFVKSEAKSFYGYTKYLSELEVWKAYQEGLETTILNPTVVLGPGDWTKSSTTLFKYIWDQNEYYSSGSINFVDVRDIASAVEKLLKVSSSGKQYILNGGKVDYQTFFEIIAKNFSKRPPFKRASKFQIRLLIAFEYLKESLFGMEPLITKETAKIAISNIEYDNSKFKKELEFKSINLENSVEWVCRQLSKKYDLKIA